MPDPEHFTFVVDDSHGRCGATQGTVEFICLFTLVDHLVVDLNECFFED